MIQKSLYQMIKAFVQNIDLFSNQTLSLFYSLIEILKKKLIRIYKSINI